jgi:hypothetical protein
MSRRHAWAWRVRSSTANVSGRLLRTSERLPSQKSFAEIRNSGKPALQPLARVGADIVLQDRRVRHVENGKANHAIRMLHSHAPRYQRSPIVADHVHAIFAELVNNGDHVRSEL